MHTMRRGKGEDSHLWTVGYHEPHADSDGPWYQWVPLKDFSEEGHAAAYVNYLNGGPGSAWSGM